MFCFSSLNEFDAVITEKKQEQLSPNIKKLIKKFMIEFI